MVLFMLLNPDLQFPYQLEIDRMPNKTYERGSQTINKQAASNFLEQIYEPFSSNDVVDSRAGL